MGAVEKTPAAAGDHSCAVAVPWAGGKADNEGKQREAQLHNVLAVNWYGFIPGFKAAVIGIIKN